MFRCSVNKSEGVVVTGGEDDKSYVWRLVDSEVTIREQLHAMTVDLVEAMWDIST